MKRILGIIVLGLVSASYAPAKTRTLVITPRPLQCRVEAADIPEAEEHGQTPFRVHMIGARGKFDWRMPLYKINNGYGDVTAASLGHANTDSENSFIIAVPTMELARVDNPEGLTLEVRSQRGDATTCLAVEAPKSLVKRDTASLGTVRASISR